MPHTLGHIAEHIADQATEISERVIGKRTLFNYDIHIKSFSNAWNSETQALPDG